MSAALSLASLLLYAAAVVANGDCLDQSEDAVAGPALESTSLNVSHDVNVDLMAAWGNERRPRDVADDVTGDGVENWRLAAVGGVSEW